MCKGLLETVKTTHMTTMSCLTLLTVLFCFFFLKTECAFENNIENAGLHEQKDFLMLVLKWENKTIISNL